MVWEGTLPQLNTENDPDAPFLPFDAIIQGNSLLPISSPYLPYVEVLASKIMDCESGNDHFVCEKGGYCDNGLAYGIAQFHEDTFYWMAGLVGLQNADWKNQNHQEYLLRWAIINKLAKQHWTCYPNE